MNYFAKSICIALSSLTVLVLFGLPMIPASVFGFTGSTSGVTYTGSGTSSGSTSYYGSSGSTGSYTGSTSGVTYTGSGVCSGGSCGGTTYTPTPTPTCTSGCCGSNCTPSCTNQCSNSGRRECYGNGYHTCGNYDSDSCLEWGRGDQLRQR